VNSPRLIAAIVVREGLHVQSFGFRKYLPVGSPVESAREFDRWGIDEIALILLDKDPKANRQLVAEVSAAVAVPLAAVGGVRQISDAKAYIELGADKIGLNYDLVRDPRLVREAAALFGNQCVIASVDLARWGKKLMRWDYWKNRTSDKEATAWIGELEKMGVGEILLNFPERDGYGKGMDVEAIRKIVNCTNLPVMALGGIGTTIHAVQCFKSASPSGIGVGNRLAYFEHSVLLFKKALSDCGAPVRAGVQASYADSPTDASGRPIKKLDKILYKLVFEQIEPEVI
jgi:cyclase